MGLKYSSCSVRSEYCHRMDSLVNQMVKKKSAFSAGDPYPSLGREDPLEKGWLPTPIFLPGEFYGLRRKKSKCAY